MSKHDFVVILSLHCGGHFERGQFSLRANVFPEPVIKLAVKLRTLFGKAAIEKIHFSSESSVVRDTTTGTQHRQFLISETGKGPVRTITTAKPR